MDMVAPPTRNKGYRVHLKGVGQVVRPQKMKEYDTVLKANNFFLVFIFFANFIYFFI